MVKAKTRKRPAPASKATVGRQALSRTDWLAVARTELISGGIGAVKVKQLARRLRVTRGSFYWHFTSHADLLRELLKSWEKVNTDPFERVLRGEGAQDGVRQFVAIIQLWADEKDYSPAFDTAVRDWARTSKEAALAVRRADERRIEVLRQIFLAIGFPEAEALIRARVAYFHQVGYYALQIRDDPDTRRQLIPLYCQVLLGTANEHVVTAFPSVRPHRTDR
jgi:AcrR family transcriptional regulator